MTTFWQEVLARPREVFARLTRAQRMGVLALVSVGVVVAILTSLLAGRANYVLLYGGLEVDDAQKICAKLTELGVPYRLSPDNSLVQVPEEKVSDAKMQLASAGLPKLGSPGFEIFDQSQFGLTDDLFGVQLQRGLQGEIERSIETMNPVKKARVIVTLPAKTTYLRDQSRPSAAVSLWLRPGLPLANSEIAAIAHYVATSVGRGIKVEDVTIVDDSARLLHPHGGEDDPMFSAAHLEKVQALERHLQDKAESQLRAAFGENKASVRVSVELDLNYRETARDTVNDENKVGVKEISSSEKSGAGASSGSDPSVSGSGKVTKEPGNVLTHEDKETEYREGSERELTIMKAGAIRRMTVSLLLDESIGKDATGAPLAAKVAEIEKAVKSAVGFSEKRLGGGKDEFNVVLTQFAQPPALEAPPGPFALENLLPLAGHVAEGVTVLVVLLFLARMLRGGSAAPAKAKVKPAAGSVAAAVAAGDDRDEDIIDLEMGEARGADLRSRVGRFVNRHPDQAREVLVAWLKEEMA